jgi:hypothetical protein
MFNNNIPANTVFTYDDGSGPLALRAHGISKAKAKVESWLADGYIDLPAVNISWTSVGDHWVLNVFDGDDLVTVATLYRGAGQEVFTQTA